MKLTKTPATRLALSTCFLAVLLMLSVSVAHISAIDGALEEPGTENQVNTESVGEESSLYQDRGLNLPAGLKKLLKAMEERSV